jgi:hypothetical protein
MTNPLGQLQLEPMTHSTVSQVIVTPGNDRVRVVRLTPRSAAIVSGDDRQSVVVNTIGEDFNTVAINWGGLWDAAKVAGKAIVGAVAGLAGGGGGGGAGKHCVTQTTYDVEYQNGQPIRSHMTQTQVCL